MSNGTTGRCLIALAIESIKATWEKNEEGYDMFMKRISSKAI